MRSALLIMVFALASCSHYSDSDRAIRKRARGFGAKALGQTAQIDASNGIDAAEALAIAEWKIFGAIDYGRLRVSDYSLPKQHGDEWRIDVNVVAKYGAVNRPIYVDKITGYSHGDGWSNDLIAETPIGHSAFRLTRRGKQLWLEVEHRALSYHGDYVAKAECLRDARAALRVLRHGLGGAFKDVPDGRIKLTELEESDTDATRNVFWHAEVLLREK